MVKSRGPTPTPGKSPSGFGEKNGQNGNKGGQPASPSSVEKFYAELDKCWELLESGDLEGAKEKALHLKSTDGDAPELYVLLGMVDGMMGDPEQALAHYEQAMEIDPDYVEPIICAAELCIWELDDCERALELAERALDLAEEEDEYVDALLLKAEAEMTLGEVEAAHKSLRELPDIPLSEPSYHLRAARLLLNLDHAQEAQEHFQRALHLEAENIDAVHGLGLCDGDLGNKAKQVEYFQKVRAADLAEEPPPWTMPEKEFSALCSDALDELPDAMRKLLANVPIIASDYPSEEMVSGGQDPRILGLFAGVPHGDKPSIGGAPHLDTIFLFQRNLERNSFSHEDMQEEIQITLIHEAGHFFGLSDAQLEAMGLG